MNITHHKSCITFTPFTAEEEAALDKMQALMKTKFEEDIERAVVSALTGGMYTSTAREINLKKIEADAETYNCMTQERMLFEAMMADPRF